MTREIRVIRESGRRDRRIVLGGPTGLAHGSVFLQTCSCVPEGRLGDLPAGPNLCNINTRRFRARGLSRADTPTSQRIS